jgi:hypothetical protein
MPAEIAAETWFRFLRFLYGGKQKGPDLAAKPLNVWW